MPKLILASKRGYGWRTSARNALAQRRRRRAGPVGCGLCGVESLEDAMRPVSAVDSDFAISAAEIVQAMSMLPDKQTLNQQTRAVHAAAFYTADEGIVALREDVGRHNALDKLIGALARQGRDAAGGVILMTSRVSIELIQKAAFARAPVLAAISAPTALALRTAEAAAIAVCGVVRDNGLEVFTRPDRITRDAD
ncbi:MAG: formate dehydrogenase accessory sulfurtransferase FdhD [Hyphomonadaceae bacterium]